MREGENINCKRMREWKNTECKKMGVREYRMQENESMEYLYRKDNCWLYKK